jgi:hypothetical protein
VLITPRVRVISGEHWFADPFSTLTSKPSFFINHDTSIIKRINAGELIIIAML